MSLESFLYMGGYGFYVWTAYGVATVVLLINLISPIVQRKQWLRQLQLKQQREQR